MPEYTKEEWESRKLTLSALFTIVLDMALMALYLLGALAFLSAASFTQPEYLSWGYLAIGMFLAINAIFIKFMRLTRPLDWYQVEIIRSRIPGTKEVTTSTNVEKSETDMG